MNADIDLRQNFLGADKTVAINSYGEYFKVGDEVSHDGAPNDETAIIESFEFDEETVEVKANTTRGHCHIDFISKIE